MAFPTTLQDLDATRATAGQKQNNPNHITHHALEDSTIEALQAKVGVNGSTVITTHDYKLSGVTGTDKAASKTGTETLTNKTLTSPTLTTPTITSPALTVGSDATGDLYYRAAGGFTRLAAIAGKILKIVDGIPAWVDEAVAALASLTVAGNVEIATTAEISAGTATGGSGAVLVVPADAVGNAASKIPQYDANVKIPNTVAKLSTGTSVTAISDWHTEKNITSFTVPANSIGTTNAIRLEVPFTDLDLPTDSTTAHIYVKYGATTMIDYSMIIGGSSTTNLRGKIIVTLTAAGAANAQRAVLDITNRDAKSYANVVMTGTATEDSTADKDLVISVLSTGTADSITPAGYIATLIR